MNYTITTLSPVHIGTGKKMTPFEFALTDNRFIVVNMDAVLAQNPSRADDLNAELAKDAERFSLSAFLTPQEINNPANWRYSAALSASAKRILQEELRKAKNMDVEECIKSTADAQVYLPGSSIKGALRTALAYAVFKRDQSAFHALKERLKRVDWRSPDEAVNELIFWGARHDPKYDLFKTLRVSDSSTLTTDDATLDIGKMKILSLTASSGRRDNAAQAVPRGTMAAQLQGFKARGPEALPLKSWWTLLEVVKPEITFSGEIAVDEQLLRHAAAQNVLGWQKAHQQQFNLNALLQAANTFAQDICEWERRFFQTHVKGIAATPVVSFYTDLARQIAQADEQTCFLCLGEGAGWNKMTVGMLLEQDSDFDFTQLRKTLRLSSDRLNFEFPKSRKLLMRSEHEIHAALGWVVVRVQNEKVAS